MEELRDLPKFIISHVIRRMVKKLIAAQDPTPSTKKMPKTKGYPTNSPEWLIQESETNLARREAESKAQYEARIKRQQAYWAQKKDEINAKRRDARAEARAKLVAELGAPKRNGRPRGAPAVVSQEASAVQGQSKSLDRISSHINYKSIAIPKELAGVFHNDSEKPEIAISESQGTWPLFNVKPFKDLKENVRKSYLNNFKNGIKAAGFEPPPNPEADPLVYSKWYGDSAIDAFAVVKANSVAFGKLSEGVPMSISTSNGRASGLQSVVVQGLLECLRMDDFSHPSCKKLLHDHFIYFEFARRAKHASGIKFNKQTETVENQERSIPWEEWMAMSREYIGKIFYLEGARMGDLKSRKALTKIQYAHIRDAVIIGAYSLIPVMRLTPWNTTVVKPVGYDVDGADRMKLNYTSEDGRVFFNDFKNAAAVRKLADPPVNRPFEQKFESPLFSKMLKTWISLNPNHNKDHGKVLFPANFVTNNEGFIDLGSKLMTLSAVIDTEGKRKFGNRLMRRAFIKWFRSPDKHKLKDNDVNELIQFMLSVHQTSPLINLGYVKTSVADPKAFLGGRSTTEVFNSIFSEIDGDTGETPVAPATATKTAKKTPSAPPKEVTAPAVVKKTKKAVVKATPPAPAKATRSRK